MKYTRQILTPKEFKWLLKILMTTETIYQAINANKFVINTLTKQRQATRIQLVLLKYNMLSPYKHKL